MYNFWKITNAICYHAYKVNHLKEQLTNRSVHEEMAKKKQLCVRGTQFRFGE